MLTIRPSQMAALSQEAQRDFEGRAIAHLRACLPGPADESTLRATVATAMAKASAYGIHNELAVLRYLNAMCLLGPNFDTDPTIRWAGALLRDPDFDGGTKMAILSDLVEQHLGT